MQLAEGLKILVDDWQDLHEDGGTKLSVEEVVGRLNVGSKIAVQQKLQPVQSVELIMNNLQRIPGAVENSEKFMAQFESADELLEEIDLDCLIADLSVSEFDDL